ncbi:hypothetical protein [Neorhodopirellula pilleata]|uniref:Uncharacterized protein n=1 Tax=Neorhodopirellula pilleata TaxID=2714738 RepID=A0A5C6A1A9_9BACT|nr:hypothetical protein [Neorhodopirellula pilleata]TWT92998.1 hypothetical protein Pla100_43140 [Neorhodopirellula pilleata]
MPVVCRLTTVVALLMHLFFGCSLHHVNGCETFGCGDRGCEQSLEMADVSNSHSNVCCGHSHSHSSEPATDGLGHRVAQVGVHGCQCESRPCDGDHPGSHGVTECSFVASADFVFIIDPPLVEFVTYEHDPMANYLHAMMSCGLPHCRVLGVQDSLSHCACLCTWII